MFKVSKFQRYRDYKIQRLNSYILNVQRPNLMNLSGGLNLSGRSNMFGSTKNCFKFFQFQFLVRNENRFLGGFKPRLKFIKFGHRLIHLNITI